MHVLPLIDKRPFIIATDRQSYVLEVCISLDTLDLCWRDASLDMVILEVCISQYIRLLCYSQLSVAVTSGCYQYELQA